MRSYNMNDLQIIQDKIYEIRGQRVMRDRDLAAMYGVETKVLNQAVKRNIKRFPDDFVFRINRQEFANLKSQFVTSSWGGVRKLPYAFTEQGVATLAGALNSDAAVRTNIVIMRAFVQMRSYLAMTPDTLAARLESIDRRLLELEQPRIAGELGPAREPALPSACPMKHVLSIIRRVPLSSSLRTDRIAVCSNGSEPVITVGLRGTASVLRAGSIPSP